MSDAAPRPLDSPARPWLRWMLAAYWLGIFLLTHWPKFPTPVTPTLLPADKIVHFTLYSGLAWLLAAHAGYIWPGLGSRTLGPRLWQIGLIVGCYALFDEVTQPLCDRDCDVWDLLCDWAATGFVLAIAARQYAGQLAGDRDSQCAVPPLGASPPLPQNGPRPS